MSSSAANNSNSSIPYQRQPGQATIGAPVIPTVQNIAGIPNLISSTAASEDSVTLRENLSKEDQERLRRLDPVITGERANLFEVSFERKIDDPTTAGLSEAVRVTGNQELEIAMRTGIEGATNRKEPPVDLRGLMQDNPGQQVVANKISEAKSSSPNINYNA